MPTKLATLVFGSLIAGSLVLSAGPALARDWDRRHYAYGRDYRPVPSPIYGYPYRYPVTGPAYSEDLYRRLDNARRKKAYDAAHHASREQLAEDNARIARLERQLGLR